MPALTLRRAGFAATLVTGTALLGSALHGLAGVNTTLELADSSARPAPKSALVSYHHRPDRAGGECDGPRERRHARRLT
jgi:hypothetical protein